MEWTTEEGADGVTIGITGDFDLYGAPSFARAALDGIKGGWRRVALDFSRVNYLDSTGVGTIIRMLQALKAAGGELRCRGLHGSPRKVLEMSNILALLREEKPTEARQ